MTLSPTAHALALARARVRLSRQGIDFDGLGLGEQFQERHRAVSRELTLFFKRVRKAAKSPLRVLLVAEAHVSGLPHYHCLVHERVSGAVGERCLRQEWSPIGFSKWNVVSDERAASYCAKYVGKSAAARVRASKDYGQSPWATEPLERSLTEAMRARGVRGDVPPANNKFKKFRTEGAGTRSVEGDFDRHEPSGRTEGTAKA